MFNRALDQTRVIAIFAVILVHTSSIYTKTGLLTVTDYEWWVSTFIQSSIRWCVPVFVMLSGALLISEKETDQSIAIFYEKRLKRLFYPLAFWSCFYSAFMFLRGVDINTIWANILQGTPFYHMWFIYMMITLYLLIPFASTIYKRYSTKTLFIFSLGLIFFHYIDGLSEKYLWKEGQQSTFIFSFIPYIGYAILGKIIFEKKLTGITPSKSLLYINLVSFLITITIAIASYYNLPGAKSALFAYSNPLIAVQALLAFHLLSSTNFLPFISSTRLRQLSTLTLGIYLIHPFFIYIGRKLFPISTRIEVIGPLPSLLSDLITIATVSYAASLLVSKTPFLRRTI